LQTLSLEGFASGHDKQHYYLSRFCCFGSRGFKTKIKLSSHIVHYMNDILLIQPDLDVLQNFLVYVLEQLPI
jgi:hypothetical protein